MQQLNVSLTIPIPADQVLISKVELEELQNNSLAGKYWNIKDLEQRTGRKVDWLKSNLLYVPKFKEILDSREGGFVYYPEARGQSWAFHAPKMAEFLDNHFRQIFEGVSA